MSNPITPSSRITCLPCIDTNLKKLALVTAVALAALALLAVGTWSLLFTIEMGRSVALQVAGSLTLCLAFFLASFLCKKKEIAQPEITTQNPPQELPKVASKLTIPELDPATSWDFTGIQPHDQPCTGDFIAAYKQEEWEHLEIPYGSRMTDDERKAKIKALDDKRSEVITPIQKKLFEIYGDQKSMPVFFGQSKIREEYALLLLTEDELLNLPYPDICCFSQEEMSILVQRLALIESRGEPQEISPPNEVNTLGDFRKIQDKQRMLDEMTSPELACIFSAKQLALLLSEEGFISNEKIVETVLPAAYPKVNQPFVKYTRQRLEKMVTLPEIQSKLAALPVAQLRLLPNTYFQGPYWKWSHDNIKKVFIQEPWGHNDRKRIAETFTIDQLLEFEKTWELAHLSLFSETLLHDPKFPWKHFCGLKGFGSWLNSYKDFAKIQSHIDWEFFVTNHEAECAAVFSSADGKVEAKLNILKIDTIRTLTSIWKLGHLRYFPFDKFSNTDFPWDNLIPEQGFGTKLREKYERDTEKLKDLPNTFWSKLPQPVILEIFQDFRIGYYGSHYTFLPHVDIKVIQLIAQHLDVSHLSKMKEDKVDHGENPDFPWDTFAKKEGFGTWLRDNNHLFPIIVEKLNWKDFTTNHRDECVKAFSHHPDHRDKTEKKLKAIKNIDTLIELKSIWEPQHIACFTFAQLSNPLFPWDGASLMKTGIGNQLLKKYQYEKDKLKNISLSWSQLSKDEVLALFQDFSGGGYPATMYSLLLYVEIEVIQTIAQHLEVSHLDKMRFGDQINHLTMPNFPWRIFMQKVGFGEWLRHEYRYPSLIKDSDWEFFVTNHKEECAKAFNYSNYDQREQLADKLKFISIPTFTVLKSIWKPHHIKAIPFDKLADKDFPWDGENLMKEGFGNALKDKYQWDKEKFENISLPWSQLSKDEVIALFQEFSGGGYPATMYSLLLYTNIVGIQAVAQHLEASHLDNMIKDTINKLTEANFPWKEFYNKPGFSAWLRRTYSHIISHINMVEFAHANPDEFQAFFAPQKDSSFNKEACLKKIQPTQLTELRQLGYL